MKVKGEPGDLFRPKSGTENMEFGDEYCDHCEADRDYKCRILLNSLVHKIHEQGYPTEWKFNENGAPCCTAFEPRKPNE